MSNETAQSSKGRAIKAYIKVMELIISAAVKPIQRALLSLGDQPERLINTIKTPPSHLLRMQRCNAAIYNICARLPIILWVGTIESWIKQQQQQQPIAILFAICGALLASNSDKKYRAGPKETIQDNETLKEIQI